MTNELDPIYSYAVIWLKDWQNTYSIYIGYPDFMSMITKIHKLSLENDWKGVACYISMIEAKEDEIYEGASNVEKILKSNKIYSGINAVETNYLLNLEGFPILFGIDFFFLFLIRNIGNYALVTKMILEFIFHLNNSKIIPTPHLKEIFNILYFMLYFNNPYSKGFKNVSEEKKEKYNDLIKKLAQRLIFLILASEDGKIRDWKFKFIMFFFF